MGGSDPPTQLELRCKRLIYLYGLCIYLSIFSNIFKGTYTKKILSACSVECGMGKAVATTITCNSQTMQNCYTNITMQDCHTNITCPPNYIYGNWSNWSKCDKQCRNGIEDMVTQHRNRTCQPLNCTTGKTGNTNSNSIFIISK